MNKIFSCIIAGMLILTACAQNNNKSNNQNNSDMKKTLIVYFSATGTTKAAAEKLAREYNADLYEITPETPYTAADLDWRDKTSRSTLEMKDKSSRPAIKGICENIAQYDTVWIGFPVCGTPPRPLLTLLLKHTTSAERHSMYLPPAEEVVWKVLPKT